MKREIKKYSKFAFVSACLILSILVSGYSFPEAETEPLYVKNRVVLKLHSFEEHITIDRAMPKLPAIQNQSPKPVSVAALMAKFDQEFTGIKQDPRTGYYIVETRNESDVEELCQRLRQEPSVIDASPDYIASISGLPPNDPYFQYQYSLVNTGQAYNPDTGATGTVGSDIKALEGWDWSKSSEDIVIAIVDSGIATDHEDLIDKIVEGANFVNETLPPYDDNGHGTFVASVAAAKTDNGLGIAGVAWNAKLMPVKVMAEDGFGSYLAIAYGIRYAVDNGATIINMSLGGGYASFILEDACQYAYEQGALLVAASGNQSSYVNYPAAYDDYCLAVGASDANDQIAYFSNYGPQVDVVAPGVQIMGAAFNPNEPENLSNYGTLDGTSISSPIVAGAAALLWSYKPFLSNEEVMTLIKITSDDINLAEYPGQDDFAGWGRINLKTLLAPYQL